MSNTSKAVMAFVIICVASAILGWTTGYNFDHRNEGVAVWTGLTLLMGGTAFGLILGGA